MSYSVTEAAQITGYSGSRIRHYAQSGDIDAVRRVWGWEITESGLSQLFELQAIITEMKRYVFPLYLHGGAI